MNKKNTLFFTLAAAGCIASWSTLNGRLFTHFIDDIEEEIDQLFEFNSSFSKLHKAFENNIHISLDAPKEILTVTISDIKADDLEAHLNNENNRLTITTATNKIAVETINNVIGVEVRKTESTKDNQATKAQFFGSSIISVEQAIEGNPILEKQTIDYNPASQELIIRIPITHQSEGKSIPINFMQSDHKKSDDQNNNNDHIGK